MTTAIAPLCPAGPTNTGLRRILDLEPLADWLAREVNWPPGLESATIALRRLWVGRCKKVSFELALNPPDRVPHRPFVIQGGFEDGRAKNAPSRQAVIVEARLCGLSLQDEHSRAWVCTPDRDPWLPGLATLFEPTALPRLFAGTRAMEWLEADVHLTSELIAWRAGRRAMLRVRSNGREGRRGVCVKTFRRPPSGRTRAIQEELGAHLNRISGGRVQVPPILEVLQNPALVFTPEIEAAVPLTHSERDLAAAAETLVRVHAAPLRLEVQHTPRAELQTVCCWLRALRPHQCAEYRRLRASVRQLMRRLARIGGSEMGPVHRDYYHAQLLRQGGVIWLTDWDTLAGGHPEVDVATFGAHLALDALLERRSSHAAAGAIANFVDRYRALGGNLDPGRMAFYLPCALLRLGALHGARGRPVELVHGMWELAEMALQPMRP